MDTFVLELLEKAMTRIVPGPFRDAGIQQVQNAEFSAVLAAKQQSWDLGKGNRLKLPRR